MLNLIPQIYRDAIPSPKEQNLVAFLRKVVKAKISGVCLHGFPTELAQNWGRLSSLCSDQGLISYASWGLDSGASEDNLQGKLKGELVSQILNVSSCSGGLLDAEGGWDKGAEDDAREFVGAVKKNLKRAVPLGDQCWFAMKSHASVRKVGKPKDSGGPLAGFPVDEFAEIINWLRFLQAYCNNADSVQRWGGARYQKIFAWMDSDWASIRTALESAGLWRDLGITIQGYGWKLSSLGHCLFKYGIQRKQPVIMWGEPFPHDNEWLMVQAVDKVAVRFWRDALSIEDNIKNFQQWAGITVDGAFGDESMKAALKKL